MNVRRSTLFVTSTILLCAASAGAQEQGQAGITMGYPSSIGVLWHVSDRVAIRPEFSVAHSDGSSSGLPDVQNGTWTIGVGISPLFYNRATDNLRTYVTPRFSYNRGTGDTGTTRFTSLNYSIAGMFGAQYALSTRFSAFGEVGLGYTRQTTTATSPIVSIETHGNTVSTRTGVGVVLYF